MSALSMCQNKNCLSALRCLRFSAVPAEHQTYNSYAPAHGDSKCKSFAPILPWDNVVPMAELAKSIREAME